MIVMILIVKMIVIVFVIDDDVEDDYTFFYKNQVCKKVRLEILKNKTTLLITLKVFILGWEFFLPLKLILSNKKRLKFFF